MIPEVEAEASIPHLPQSPPKASDFPKPQNTSSPSNATKDADGLLNKMQSILCALLGSDLNPDRLYDAKP